MTYLFTSESVSEGHPDKLCDMISDAILDECLSIDPGARVAVETMVKGTDSRSYIFIGGEVTIASNNVVDYERVARRTAREIGYDDHSVGMDAASEDLCQVVVRITQQSPDISQGVDQGKGLHLEQGSRGPGSDVWFRLQRNRGIPRSTGDVHAPSSGFSPIANLQDVRLDEGWFPPMGSTRLKKSGHHTIWR